MLRQSQLGFLHIASGATVAAVTGTGSSQAAEAQLQLWSPNTYLFKIFGACIASPYVEEVVLRDSGFTKKTFVETQPGMATDIAGFVMPVIVSADQRSAPYGRVTRASDYFPTARRPMPAPIFFARLQTDHRCADQSSGRSPLTELTGASSMRSSAS